MVQNGGTSKWITIIVSIIIVAISISIGVIRTSQKDKIYRLDMRLTKAESKVDKLAIDNSSQMAEINTKLRYMQKNIDDINKKLDVIIGWKTQKR